MPLVRISDDYVPGTGTLVPVDDTPITPRGKPKPRLVPVEAPQLVPVEEASAPVSVSPRPSGRATPVPRVTSQPEPLQGAPEIEPVEPPNLEPVQTEVPPEPESPGFLKRTGSALRNLGRKVSSAVPRAFVPGLGDDEPLKEDTFLSRIERNRKLRAEGKTDETLRGAFDHLSTPDTEALLAGETPEGDKRPPSEIFQALLEENESVGNQFIADTLLKTVKGMMDWDRHMRADAMNTYISMEKNLFPERYAERMKRWEEQDATLYQGGTQTEANILKKLHESETEHERQGALVLAQGGVPARIAYELASTAWRTSSMLLLSKAALRGLPGAPVAGKGTYELNVLKHAFKFSAYRYVTTPGTPEEKAKAAQMALFYAGSPAASSGANTDAMAKVFDFAVNSGISIGDGVYAGMFDKGTWTNEEARAEFITRATSAVVSDILFALGTRSVRADARANQAARDNRQHDSNNKLSY